MSENKEKISWNECYKISKCVKSFFENYNAIYINLTPNSVRLESHNTHISDDIQLQAIILFPQSTVKKCYAEYKFTTKSETIPHLLPLSPYDYELAMDYYDKYKYKTSPFYSIKHDKNKLQLALFPKEAIEAVCEVIEFNNNKYSQDILNKIEDVKYINTAAKHLYAMQNVDKNNKEYIDLSKIDDESGLEHLYHLAYNIVYAIALYKRNKEKYKK